MRKVLEVSLGLALAYPTSFLFSWVHGLIETLLYL